MGRRRQSVRHATQVFLAAIAASGLVACGGDPEPSEEETLEAIELSDHQRVIAEALLEGYRKETGETTVDAADIARAGCYAQNVDIPAQFSDVHRQYLADYTAIDADFYPWFEARGVSMDDAWDIAERVKKGLEACQVS